MRHTRPSRRIFPSRTRTHRAFYNLVLLMCAAPIAFAYYLQTVYDLAACPLCILQRYSFWFMGLMALVGLFWGRLPRWLDALAIFAGMAGVATAGYHLWLLHHPSGECVKDTVQLWLNQLPTAKHLPLLFAANGNCTAELPLVFGLSIPTWSLLGLSGITFLWLLFVMRRR